jgi:outer membrane lipoprotein SlyB
MSITFIVILMAAIVVVGTVIGAVRGLTIDDTSPWLGAFAGAYISGNLAIAVGGVLAAIHFIGKYW